MSLDDQLITVLIPCRNESRFIDGCLKSVQAFELPQSIRTEIFVIDGRSTDDTRERVEASSRRWSNIRLIDNPEQIQSTAMNIGLLHAKGAWLLRLDAHATYPSNYLRLCFETAQRTRADNVGGLFITEPGSSSYSASLVQALTTHKFGVGNAGFRLGAAEGPADTVPYGFFRTEIFNRLGKFDERLVRAQDYEFNRRILAAGGTVWRNPHIHVHYYNQPSLSGFLRKQYLLEAPYNAYLWYVAPYAFAVRHAVTGAFAAGVIVGAIGSVWIWPMRMTYFAVLSLYVVLALGAAFQQARRYRRFLHIFTLPAAFFLYHLIHGFGVLVGLSRLLMGMTPVQSKTEPWQGAARRSGWYPGLTLTSRGHDNG